MSFTVVAVSTATGEQGMVTSAGIPCCGMLSSHGYPSLGLVVTKGWSNFSHPAQAYKLLAAGLDAHQTVQQIVAADPGSARRQLIIADAYGNIAIHSGDGLDEWKGHQIGDGYVVAGNYLTGPEPLAAMASAFESATGTLADRLIATADVGQHLGADRRGKISAALMVVKGRQYPPISVRVDHSPTGDAVTELVQAYQAFLAKTYALFPHFDWPDRW